MTEFEDRRYGNMTISQLEAEINMLVECRGQLKEKQLRVAMILDTKVLEQQRRLRLEIQNDPERLAKHQGLLS